MSDRRFTAHPSVEVDAAIERGQRKAARLGEARARLSLAMGAILEEADFAGLMAAVQSELQRLASRLGPGKTGGWIG